MREVDKSLLEVWEWKDKVYEEMKDLNAEEYVERVKADAKKFAEKYGLKLRRVTKATDEVTG